MNEPYMIHVARLAPAFMIITFLILYYHFFVYKNKLLGHRPIHLRMPGFLPLHDPFWLVHPVPEQPARDRKTDDADGGKRPEFWQEQ